MASLPDKETSDLNEKLAVVGELDQDNVLMSQTATVSCCKKKRAKSKRFNLLRKEQQQQQIQDTSYTQNEFQSNDHPVYVYNAIKLTNYYTNLLFKKQKCDKLKTTTGANWRTKQLAQQIPHQDIKLLALENMAAATTTTTTTTTCKGQSADEVKFIRNQRKVASQFKASLYYLNPTQTLKVNSSGCSNNNWLKNTSSPSSSLLLGTKEGCETKNHHQCFKVSSSTSIWGKICLFNWFLDPSVARRWNFRSDLSLWRGQMITGWFVCLFTLCASICSLTC